MLRGYNRYVEEEILVGAVFHTRMEKADSVETSSSVQLFKVTEVYFHLSLGMLHLWLLWAFCIPPPFWASVSHVSASYSFKSYRCPVDDITYLEFWEESWERVLKAVSTL